MRWIFFDLGWTLVNEIEAHRARFEELQPMLEQQGVEMTWLDFETACEDAATEFSPSPFLGALTNLGISTAFRKEIVQVAKYRKDLETIYEGVPEMLASLAKHHRLGIIANQSAGTIHRLKRWKLDHFFSCIVASAEAGLSKPDPRIFELAIDETQCAAQDALMVGDRLDNDIGPAKRAGWSTARILQGFSRNQEPRNQAEKPDMTCDSIAHLKELT